MDSLKKKKYFNDLMDSFHGVQPIPYRATKKIRRNEPCPCGSNKKYKKCCIK